MVEGRIPEREVRIRGLHTPCCVLELDTLLRKNIGNIPKAVAPFDALLPEAKDNGVSDHPRRRGAITFIVM